MNLAMYPQKEVFDIGAFLFKGMSSFSELFVVKESPRTHTIRYELVPNKSEQEKSIARFQEALSKANKAIEKLDFEGLTVKDAQMLLSVFNLVNNLYSQIIKSVEKSSVSNLQKSGLLSDLRKTTHVLSESIEALEIYADEETMDDLKKFVGA